MKLSKYIKEMTELLEKEGDMDCISINPSRSTYYKVEQAGYTTLVRVDQMKNNYEFEDFDEQEVEWLIENEYIDSEGELVKVCVVNG